MIFIGICFFLVFFIHLFLKIFHVLYLWVKNIVENKKKNQAKSIEENVKSRVKDIKRKYPRAYKQFVSNIDADQNLSSFFVNDSTAFKKAHKTGIANKYTFLEKIASRSDVVWAQEERDLEYQETWYDVHVKPIIELRVKKEIEEERKRKEVEELNHKNRELETAYPNGFKRWKCLNPYKTAKETIECVNEIQQLEKFYKESQRYDFWEKEQKEFAEKSDDIAEECLTKFGGRTYDIPFEKTDIDGKKVSGTYKVWHYFLRELCLDEDLDYTLFPDENECLAKLPKFKAKNRYFKEGVYKQIIDFINELQKEEKVLVYISGNVPGWSMDSLYYHYKNIFPAFDEKNMYAPVLYETLGLKNVDWISNLKRRIVIIDMMTDTSHLKEICKSIIEEAKEKQPLIAYISLIKCYTKEEAQEIIDDKKKEIEEEEKKRRELYKKRMKLATAESNYWAIVKGVRHYFFYYYYPTRFDDVTEFDWDVRNLIWDFKDGKKHNEVCEMLTTKLKRVYGEALDLLTFVCIPASTREVNHKRYCSFMADVCNATGMENGYDHITIVKEKEPARLGGTSVAEYTYDKEFFNSRQIILFDDVVTRGRSLAKMKMELEGVGAHIVAALSIGRTYSDYYGDIRKQHPWLEENEDYEIETI